MKLIVLLLPNANKWIGEVIHYLPLSEDNDWLSFAFESCCCRLLTGDCDRFDLLVLGLLSSQSVELPFNFDLDFLGTRILLLLLLLLEPFVLLCWIMETTCSPVFLPGVTVVSGRFTGEITVSTLLVDKTEMSLVVGVSAVVGMSVGGFLLGGQ